MSRLKQAIKRLKWFYPGLHIKRWVLVAMLGSFLISIVLLVETNLINTLVILKQRYPNKGDYTSLVLFMTGVFLVIKGLRTILSTISSSVLPEQEETLVDRIYRSKTRGKGAKFVTIGGGTGVPVILKGLKKYSANISAIVAMADDGGSSGKLRADFDMLPPGDVRNSLVALADAEPLMRELFQYRFKGKSDLNGHSFGNLFLTAMNAVTDGDLNQAIKESSRILAIRGVVHPSTLERIQLSASFEDGTVITGESGIPKAHKRIRKVVIIPDRAMANIKALEAIDSAETIILGPGSLYTSIMPNLLVRDIAEHVRTSLAIKVYICNIMTQPGETDEYSVSDHLKVLFDHAGGKIVDYVLINNRPLPDQILANYFLEGSFPVDTDINNIRSLGVTPIFGRLAIFIDNKIRHDADAAAKIVMGLTLNHQANLKEK